MKKQDEIEDLFASNFRDFERMPPMDLKNSIDERLFDQGKVGSKRGFFWILSILGLISFVTVLTYHTDFRKKEILLADSNAISALNKYENSESSTQKSKTENHTIKKINQKNIDIKPGEQVSQNKLETDSYSGSIVPSVRKDELNKYSFLEKGKTGFVSENRTKVDQSLEESVIPSKGIELTQAKKKVTETDKSSISEMSKEDSIQASQELASKSDDQKDSTKNENVISKQHTDSLPSMITKNELSPWSISYYLGTSNGINKLVFDGNHEFNLKEKLGFYSSLELNYQVLPRFGLTSGFDYSTHKETFEGYVMEETQIIDTTEEYVYNQNGDSIIDTIYYTHYTIETNKEDRNLSVKHFSISVPLYLSYTVLKKNNWDILLKGGVRFTYMKNSVNSSNNGFYDYKSKQFGLKISLRPQVVYSFNKFGIGTYLHTGYDVTPITHLSVLYNIYSYTMPHSPGIYRKRFEIGAGILLRYQF